MNKLVGFVVLVASLALGSAWMAYKQSVDRSHIRESDMSVVIDIPRGANLNQVVQQLTDKHAVEKTWFRVLVWMEGASSRIKAGEYEFSPGMTPRQILQHLIKGKVLQYAVTLVEGQTFTQLLTELHQHPQVQQTVDPQAPYSELMKQLEIPETHPEGLFLPETYFFVKGTSDQAILKRAYRAMQAYIHETWPGRMEKLPLETPYEALILASIVEKETAVADERTRIAGLFIKRLQIGMKLQTDPTVIYGMGKAYKGDIRFRDLRKDTPYNTYTRYGLPPTPIAMPGKASIDAVLHPEIGNSLYFVSRGDGTHVFSETLKEHNRAVDKYQRKR